MKLKEMKHMKKFSNKLMGIILSAFICLSAFACPGLALGAEPEVKAITVCRLSSEGVISASGLTASSMYTNSGEFTMKLSGSDIYRSVEIPTENPDISDFKAIQLWVFNANTLKPTLTLGLISDNPDTTCLDYYVASFTVGSKGWNLITLDIGEDGVFTANHKPLGFDSIGEVRLWPYYGGITPIDGSELYFDDIIAVSDYENKPEELPDEEDDIPSYEIGNTGFGEGADDMMGYDFSRSKNAPSNSLYPFSTAHRLSGDGTVNYGGQAMLDSFVVSRTNGLPFTDWSGYQYIQMTLYSEEPTGAELAIFVGSENSLTGGVDGYYKKFTVSFTGWKTFTFDFSRTDCFYRTPVGRNKITSFELWPTYVETTNLFIDRIWLTNSPIEDIGANAVDNTKDYELSAKLTGFEHNIQDDLRAKGLYGVHPRLIMTQSDFENLKTYVKTVPFMRSAYEGVKASADEILKEPVYPWTISDGKRLDRIAAGRILPLALTYKITGNKKYFDRLWAEMECISLYPDWNPAHDIDVGDYGRPMALAYDWIYNDLTDEQRRIVRNGLLRCGLHSMMVHVRTTNTGFAKAPDNHCTVTGSGLGMIALAIADEPKYEALANEVVNQLVKIVPKYLSTFGPEGVCIEGPSYWAYGHESYALYQAACYSALGTDYGIHEIEGLSRTGQWLIDTNSASGISFNFGDADEKPIVSSALLWFSRLYNQPGLAAYRIAKSDVASGGSYDMLFYRAGMGEATQSTASPLDAIYSGSMPTGSIRSTWANDYGNSILFKGGSGSVIPHADLDAGTFVLDSMGERWIKDLGSDNYELPGMFGGNGDDSGRWRWYRKRAEGHNTLVVNPAYTPGRVSDQNAVGKNPITKLKSFDSAAYAIVDMTNAYTPALTGVKRGYALVNGRNTFIIQDEITNSTPADIYSFYHTGALVELSADKKSAVLSQNGKKLKATVASPANAKFEIMKAETLISEYAGGGQNENAGIQKLAIKLEDAVSPTISVVFRPLYDGVPELEMPELLPHSAWDMYYTESASLSLLSAGGVPVENFNADNTSYVIKSEEVCELSAVASTSTADLSVVQPTEETKTGYVYVSDGNKENIYTVSFEAPVRPMKTESAEGYEIKGVSASKVPQIENPPESAIDGHLSSRFSADGDVWLTFDLGEAKQFNKVYFAFMSGDQRRTIFEIEVSDDGESWQEVFKGRSSGNTVQLEGFDVGMQNARYVRFVGHGNTSNEWNSITETLIAIPDIRGFEDIDGHWANESINYMFGQGIVNGVDESHFAPEANVTRAEAFALVSRMMALETQVSDGGKWYEPYITVAKECGYIPSEWLSDVLPESELSREEMCMLISSVYKYATATPEVPCYNLTEKFEDASMMSESGRKAVDECLTLRLVKGIDETHFNPKGKLTRAEATVLLERLYLMIV